MKPKLEVGQILWFESGVRHLRSQAVAVEKIGRKWVQIGYAGRMDIETWWVDNGGSGSSPGQCYLTQRDAEAEKELSALWRGFMGKVRDRWTRPASITTERIREAAKILEIEL